MTRFLAGLLALVLTAFPQAQAATRYVGSCGTPSSATIAAAMTAASDGDTLLICPGIYSEAVTVSKNNLTIRGSTGNRADVTVSHSGIPFTLSGAGATLKDMTIISSNNSGISRGWTSTGSAYTFENLAVTAKDKGIYIEVSAKVTMRNLNVTSTDNDAIHLAGGASGAHEFDTMTLSAKEYGLYAYRGGAVFKDLTITSSEKDALLMYSDYDAALDGLTLSADEGYGINMGWARYNRKITVSNSEISAKEQGIRIEKSDKVTLTNLSVTSRESDAIFLGEGASGAHALSNLTLEAEDAGVRVDSSLWSASIDNICVNEAEVGVWISQWNARNVSITDSKFNTNSYGIRTDADPSYKTIASGNCVLKSSVPRAYSNSTAHTFNGNFWQGVSTSIYLDGNVRDNATLTACPVSSCYGEPGPVTPYADWHMDEAAWSGAAAEVVDDSGNAHHGTRVGGAQTAPAGGKLCGAGDFPANSSDAIQDAVSTGVDIDAHIGNKGAIAFWYKSDAAWIGGGKRALFDASKDPNYFFLMLTNSGTLRFGLEDSAGQDVRFDSGAQDIAAGVWTHIAVTWDLPADRYRIYLNGSLIKSDSTNTNGHMGTLDTLYIGDNRGTYHPGGTANSANGLIDEFLLFNSALSDSAIATLYANQNSGLNWDGSARTCPASETPPAGFNCVETGASANDGRLYTKLAGVNFTFDIVALKADGTVESSYATSGDKTVSVELVDGAGDTACAGRTTRVTWPSQTFRASDAGRISASAASVANAYANLRCRVSDGATTGCSTDAFAIRPQGLTLTSADANADAAGGDAHATPAIRTGTTFTLQATAVTGYDGTPAISADSVLAHAGAVRAGSLVGAFGAASALTGVSSGNFTYDEVGYFRLAALGARDTTFTAVDSGSGDCTTDYSNTAVGGRYGCHFGNAAATSYFGRFIPDHFALTPGDLTHGCGAFTYFGQSFATDFTLAAQNHNNATTQNYTGDFARLGLTDWGGFHFAASGTSLTQGDDAPSGAWSNGVASVTATHRAARAQSGTPNSPADLNVKAAPQDADGVTMTAAAVSTAAAHRFGRLRLLNASGSEYRALHVPLTAQYWNGSGFVTNTLDACTTPGAPSLTFYADSARNKLASGETTATYANSPLSAGDAGLSLSAPGDNNFGFVDLSVDAPDWLEYVWDSVDQDADSNLFDDDPTARASFGQRASGSKVIIRREIY